MVIRTRVVWIVLLVWAGFWAAEARSQSTKTGEIEAGANYSDLTNDFAPQAGAYLRLILKTGDRDTWHFEALRQREFGDKGSYFSVADSHTFGPDWYLFGAVGGSSGGFFLPEVRIDGQLNRKWLAKKKLITSIGGGYFKAKDAHRDASLSVGGIYYFDTPWVIQGGVRWNRSMPGAVISRSQFLALSQGREGMHNLVLRGEIGREAYQAIAEESILVNFPSHAVSVTWKQWLGESWGVNAVSEYYKSDVYRRIGASVGIFKSF